MDISGNDIADVVLKQFDSLPAKGKPLVRGPGLREWVPLSAIVAQRNNNLTCLAAATGMKCLPQNKISQAQGIILHDWHAEILAIRSFNRFLLGECHALALSGEEHSDYVRLRTDEERTEKHSQPFALNEGVKLHMYCSEAPCGDASMELTMAAQTDATPWTIRPTSSSLSPDHPVTPSSISTETSSTSSNPLQPASTILLHGRAYFSSLGIVRRKPSRPDSPPTLSKSCSDKLAHKQCTSLLSSPVSLLLSPSSVYLSTFTLPQSQYSATACTRAFSAEGRMAGLFSAQTSASTDTESQTSLEKLLSSNTISQPMSWQPSGYTFHPFTILTTTREFKYSRRQDLSTPPSLSCSLSSYSSPTPTTTRNPHPHPPPNSHPPSHPSPDPPSLSHSPTPPARLAATNLSLAWTPHLTETLINGILQGRRKHDPRGASAVCRRRIWKLALDVATLLVVRQSREIAMGVGAGGGEGEGEGGPRLKDVGDGQVEADIAGTRMSKSSLSLSGEYNHRILSALQAKTYGDLKGNELLEGRRRVNADVRREALKGWIVNSGGEGFGVEGVES